MNGREIAIGSRGSPLALAQARLVRDALARQGTACRIVVIETEGDRRAPDTAWGEGAFVAAIERALHAGRVDLAVHSAKDVPTDEDPRLEIAAYLPRADPRDALVVRSGATARTLADLPSGARVGTDSPRRTGFLLARRPDLAVHPLHGNVDTRLRRLDDGETDALVLACAGLDRMGLGTRITERLHPETVPPAPGQGAIAIQVRRDDRWTLAIAAGIDDAPTRRAVEAERAFLQASGGGCRAPIGALATIVGEELELVGGHANPNGADARILRRRGPVAFSKELGRELAALLAVGGDARVSPPAVTSTSAPPIAARVLVTRAADQAHELAVALRNQHLDPILVPSIEIEFAPPRGELDAATGRLQTYEWVVITSSNGARAILKAAERRLTELGAPSWAAIGPATRSVLEREGIEIHFQPSQSSGAAMAAGLPVGRGDRVLVVRGDLADHDVAAALRAKGAAVDDVIAYRTREAPDTSRALLRTAVAAGPITGAVFTSGSTVRGLVSLGDRESIDVRSISAICIGPKTADEARATGFRVVAVSPTPDPAALAAATAGAIVHQPQETS